MCRTQLTGRQSTGVAKRALNENRDSQSMCKMWDVWVCVEFSAMTWSGISRKACKRQARHATSVLSAVMEATPGSAHTALAMTVGLASAGAARG